MNNTIEGVSWIKQAEINAKELNDSANKDWAAFCEQKKIKQAFAKLEELGYYHDSGLYGWLKEEDKYKDVRGIHTQQGEV